MVWISVWKLSFFLADDGIAPSHSHCNFCCCCLYPCLHHGERLRDVLAYWSIKADCWPGIRQKMLRLSKQNNFNFFAKLCRINKWLIQFSRFRSYSDCDIQMMIIQPVDEREIFVIFAKFFPFLLILWALTLFAPSKTIVEDHSLDHPVNNNKRFCSAATRKI